MKIRLVIETKKEFMYTDEYKKYLKNIMWQLKHYIGHNFKAKIQGNSSVEIEKFVKMEYNDIKKQIMNMYLDNQAFIYNNEIIMVKYHIFF